MTVDALTRPFIDVVAGTSSSGTVRIFLPSSFRPIATGGLRNVPNRVVQFAEGVVPNNAAHSAGGSEPNDAVQTLLAQVGPGSFGIWLLPITGHKFISGTVSTGSAFAPLDLAAVTMVQATYDTVIETLRRAPTYADALTAVKGLNPYTPSVHTTNQPSGSLRPVTVAYIVEMAGTAKGLSQFMLQAYSTTSVRSVD